MKGVLPLIATLALLAAVPGATAVQVLDEVPDLPGLDDAREAGEAGGTPIDHALGEEEGAQARQPVLDGPQALRDDIDLFGTIALVITGLGVTGFALVTRYVSPKEALKNPQRSMLYGFIKAQPGVHLKGLSEEFGMKSSSILWHIRKLESADLVRSESSNGFRVFYPVEGGVAAKELGRAVSLIQNANARRVLEVVSSNPGITTKRLASHIGISAGNVRWHVRKMRDGGLMEELVRSDQRSLYPTPLGSNALESAVGRPTTNAVAANATPSE